MGNYRKFLTQVLKYRVIVLIMTLRLLARCTWVIVPRNYAYYWNKLVRDTVMFCLVVNTETVCLGHLFVHLSNCAVSYMDEFRLIQI